MAASAKKATPAKKSAPKKPKLHLPSLKIRNFRGLKKLDIPRLGRVTLLAGKNGTGKTTVLEAVRLYAACGQPDEIVKILNGRDEIKMREDEDGDQVFAPDWESLFFSRVIPSSDVEALVIGPVSNGAALKVVGVSLDDKDIRSIGRRFPMRMPMREIISVFEISFGNKSYKIPVYGDVPRFFYRRFFDHFEDFHKLQINCVSRGANVPDNDFIANHWNNIALTEKEEWALKTLSLVTKHEGELKGVAVRSTEDRNSPQVIVRTEKYPEPFSLKSLGDGAFRLFAIALALVNARDGFLVIDEVENGLHHSIMRDFWKIVLQTAHDNNVQVLATTHGWSCVTGFARAANDLKDIEGLLVRIDREGDETRSVEYGEEDLKVAAEQGIEVR